LRQKQFKIKDDPGFSAGRKQAEKFIQLQTYTISYRKGKMNQRVKSRSERVQLRLKSVQPQAVDRRATPKIHNWILVEEVSLKPDCKELNSCFGQCYVLHFLLLGVGNGNLFCDYPVPLCI
jgi:hypothetical protein